MRKLIDRIRHSLSARLSIWVVLFTALIFLASLGYMSFASRDAVKREAVNRATQVLDNLTARVNGILDNVEIAANNLDWLVYRNMDNSEAMFDLGRNVLLNNPDLNGCSISFEPYFYKERGEYFSAYAYWEDGSVLTEQEGSDSYQYFYLDWYLLPKLLNQPCWTEPYVDIDVENDYANVVTSYCKPLTAADGTYAGSFSVDISLSWLSEMLSEVKPYENAACILIGRSGAFLVHPDTTKLLRETIFTETLATPNEQMSELGHAMIEGESGMRRFKIDGKKTFIFFEPIKQTGWSVALFCPEKEIFSNFNRFQRILATIVLLGLLMMLFVSHAVVSRELAPLKQLARQADRIATGDFDEALLVSERGDEIGQLTHSFSDMQTSLVRYIDELTNTTASRERIEGELRIARDIQMAMIPRVFPPFPERREIDLYAAMTPAKEVGGDLYDYFILRDKLYFCIGDVSGKGIPGSLLMAVTRNLFRVVAQPGLSPDRIARQINETVSQENEQMMFMTMFIGRIDLQTGRMDYCNCGHNPPVMIAQGGSRLLDVKPNTPLGIDPDWAFEAEHVTDIRGHAFLFYTDGLNEAENLAHEQFGYERMLGVLDSKPFTTSQEAIERITLAVTDFVGGAEASDDLTLLCLKIGES